MAKKKTNSPLPRRPSNIPASAEWVEEWKQWAVGPRERGKRNGMWKCWRPDGSLQEETWLLDDVPHGSSTRYHPDGSLAQKSTFEHGRPREVRLFLTDKKTDEPHDKHPAPIREVHAMFDEKGRQTSVARFDAKGRLRRADGRPAPPRPANVPPEAYLVPGGDIFKIGSLETPAEGLTVEWDFSGKVRVVSYQDAAGATAEIRLIDEGKREVKKVWRSPLLLAAKAGDQKAIERLLEVGAQHSPNLFVYAWIAGLPDWARKLAALPEVEATKTPPRRAHIPTDAIWVPSLDLGRWVTGVSRATNEPPTKIVAYTDAEPWVTQVDVHDFEEGRLRKSATYWRREAEEELKRAEWFDREGNRIKWRTVEYDAFDERESTPGGPSVKRWGVKGQVRGEKRYSASGAFEAGLAFDSNGRLRMRFDHGGVGTILDVAGNELAQGPVDDEGFLKGKWKLVTGAVVDVSRFGLGPANAHQLPVLARLAKEPVPKHLEGAAKVKWGNLSAFFDVEPKEVVLALRAMALDEPDGVLYGIDALYDSIYHQDTIDEITGPVLAFMIATLRGLENRDAIAPLCHAIAEVATLGFDLDAMHVAKRAYSRRKNDTKREISRVLSKADVSPAYGEIFAALAGMEVVLTRLASDDRTELRRDATYLLGLMDSPKAMQSLARLLDTAAGAADAARVLSLFDPKKVPMAALRKALSHPSEDLRREAALTLIRLGAADDAAVAVVLERIKKSRDSEAAVVLTLLPNAAEHLDKLVATLRKASLGTVYGVARAALEVARSVAMQADREDDATFSTEQRAVLQAIADNATFWKLDVNASEVLRAYDLPTQREALMAALSGRAHEGAPQTTFSAASGLAGPSVGSWRDRS